MKFIDLTGQRFGRLIVTGMYCPLPKRNSRQGYVLFQCTCICGKYLETLPASLRQKKVQSCGCLRKEVTASRLTTHGCRTRGSSNKLYSCWKEARKRCNNQNCKSYPRYGGRGIKMLFTEFSEYEDHLLKLYPNLYELLELGYQIDRIDNDGNYEIGNLQVVTCKQNNNNRRDNRIIKIFNTEGTLAAHVNNPLVLVGYQTVLRRLQHGWTPEEALYLPSLQTQHGSWSLAELKIHKFPNDITLEEALAPVYLDNPRYGPRH